MKRNLLDVCAGNALTSILAVHLLPVNGALAIDTSPRRRNGYRHVQRWEYGQGDFTLWTPIDLPFALVAVHACGKAAIDAIACFHRWDCARLLVLMPCCHGNQTPRRIIPQAFRDKISKYEAWAWWLAEQAGGDLYVDPNILSPCNAIVVARKA